MHTRSRMFMRIAALLLALGCAPAAQAQSENLFGWNGLTSLGRLDETALYLAPNEDPQAVIAVVDNANGGEATFVRHLKQASGAPVVSEVRRSFTRKFNRLLSRTAQWRNPAQFNLYVYVDGMPLIDRNGRSKLLSARKVYVNERPTIEYFAEDVALPGHQPMLTLHFTRGATSVRAYSPEPRVIRWADYDVGRPTIAAAIDLHAHQQQAERAIEQRRLEEARRQQAAQSVRPAACGATIRYCEAADPWGRGPCGGSGFASVQYWECEDYCVSIGQACHGFTGFCDTRSGQRYQTDPCK